MRKNPLDERRVLDACDDLERAAAALAGLDVNGEHALQTPHPAHAHGLRRPLLLARLRFHAMAAARRRHRRT
jgi:hypothetical protein